MMKKRLFLACLVGALAFDGTTYLTAELSAKGLGVYIIFR